MFCFHKYGKKESDGYQYCTKCGKARKLPCMHKWKMVKENLYYEDAHSDMPSYSRRIYECQICGEMKKRKG
jgi:hypothetical protein